MIPNSSFEHNSSRFLYEQYGAAMAYVEIVTPEGVVSMGSSFHIGNGVMITAKHVVDGNKIKSVATTESYTYENPDKSYEEGVDKPLFLTIESNIQSLESEVIYFHSNPEVDVAAFKIVNKMLPAIPLGIHLDEALIDCDYMLRSALVMGYPPVPTSKYPVLVAMTTEISAIVDKYHVPHVHFIMSSTPRGGFSGGVSLVAFNESNHFAIGIIVNSLHRDDQDPNNGFMSVLSTHPIFTLIEENDILPQIQNSNDFAELRAIDG